MEKKIMLTPELIIKTIKQHKKDINKFGVVRIGLFGSFAKKKANIKSDIDFLVVLDNPTLDNYMDLKFLLERLFKRKVDLVIEDNLKPTLDYIKEEALYA